MGPFLLVCGGCGLKLRTANLERARTGNCPHCASPLTQAVARSIQHQPKPQATLTPELIAQAGGAAQETTPRLPINGNSESGPTRARWVFAAAALLLGSSLIHFYTFARSAWGRPGTKPAGLTRKGPDPARRDGVSPPLQPSLVVLTSVSACSQPEPASNQVSVDVDSAVPTEPPRPTPVLEASLALRAPQVDGSPPPQPTPSVLQITRPAGGVSRKPGLPGSNPFRVVAAPVATPAPPDQPTPTEPRRLLVRDQNGKAVIAREHGMLHDQMAVVLPDGTIGWPTNLVDTDEKFVPSTIDELEKTLQDGEYAAFRVVKTAHYLVFYQSSERFARDSADLLEKLYERLIPALRKQKAPVTEAEFPLIAVIFRSEEDFRANREVARDVQAYYEILSNRIFFFEKSKRDAASPEVSAFRKPQTVAHEGTHQLLHNVGIQPRMSPWPIWLVEGLAEYCSPPKSTKKGGLAWDGLGQVNPIHLATIRDLDDPMSAQVRGGPKAPSARDRHQPLVEYLVTRTELTPTDYALSWGLAHYLAVKKVDQLFAYIRQLNQLRPFEVRTPEQQLADFRAIFGKNLAKLDAQVADHLDKLKVPEAQALPFYAVLIAQPVARNSVRRMAMVSQSPSVIRQWFEEASNSSQTEFSWHVVPHPNRTRAVMTAETWVQEGR